MARTGKSFHSRVRGEKRSKFSLTSACSAVKGFSFGLTTNIAFCDTENVSSADPKSVKVHLSTGDGVDIEWKDGHLSQYAFPFLRYACPCALCDDERTKSGRQPGEEPHAKPGELPMFKAQPKPVSAEPVGKYALRFKWNDGHELGIYSWQWLRQICPCEQCLATTKPKAG